MGAPKGNKFAKGNKGGKGAKPIYSVKLIPIIKGMCEDGATDYEIAERIGISTNTLRWWRSVHKELAVAMILGKDAMGERAKTSLFHRAVGYTYKSEKVFQFQGQIVRAKTTEHVPPDVAAAIRILGATDPATWRDRKEVKVDAQFSLHAVVSRALEMRAEKSPMLIEGEKAGKVEE